MMERILFRPAIKVLDCQEGDERSIKDRITHINERITQQEEDKVHRWQECKKTFSIPDIELLGGQLQLKYPEHMPYREPEPIIKHALAKELRSIVIEGVTHGL